MIIQSNMFTSSVFHCKNHDWFVNILAKTCTYADMPINWTVMFKIFMHIIKLVCNQISAYFKFYTIANV